jgi:alpha-amylase
MYLPLGESADPRGRSLPRVLSWVKAFEGQVYILFSACIPSSRTSSQTAFFDVPLHDNFWHASTKRFDLRRILDNTLLKARPNDAVTFVDNHE